MATKVFNVSFPKELADQIDKKAKEQFGSRSDFLRVAALKYLREEQEWDSRNGQDSKPVSVADERVAKLTLSFIERYRKDLEILAQK